MAIPVHDNGDSSGVKIPPPLIYIIVFAAALVLQFFFPATAFPQAPARAIAIVFAVLSGLFSTWSIHRFRRAGTNTLPIKPTTALVTTGPYRFSRNPMYLSLLFLHAALGLWFDLFWAIVLMPVLIVVIRFYAIAKEEHYLERKFGQEYLDYKRRVRRWL